MRWAVALLVAGCQFKTHAMLDAAPNGSDGVIVDAPIPPMFDAPDGSNLVCLGHGAFEVCVPMPSGPFSVPGPQNLGIDTDSSAQCIYYPQVNGPSLCVIAATTITVDQATLFLSGSLASNSAPAVLFATDSIHIGNGVDVGSHQNGQAQGGGADSALCTTGTGAGTSGGGAGGSFGTKGGDAGAGGAGVAQDRAGQPQNADVLRGGCRGDDGGDGPGGGGGGNHGGGAVLLLAGNSITIDGFVNASGAGGNPGTHVNGGGGGGGSGGMIVMDSPVITVTGNLLANGGGGGGGGSQAGDGHAGKDADTTKPLAATPGGTDGGGMAGAGASGAGGNISAGNTSDSPDGAGGAGGGLGAIRVLTGQSIGGTESPDPTP